MTFNRIMILSGILSQKADAVKASQLAEKSKPQKLPQHESRRPRNSRSPGGRKLASKTRRKLLQGYIGCFNDTAKRDLPKRIAGNNLSLSECAQKCSGYAYYGIQHTHVCFCGNSYGAYGVSTSCKCREPNVGGWVNCVYKQPGNYYKYEMIPIQSGKHINWNCPDGALKKCINPLGKGHNYGFTTKADAEDACNRISECGGYKDDKNGSKKYHLRRNSDPTELTGPFKSGAHEVFQYKKGNYQYVKMSIQSGKHINWNCPDDALKKCINPLGKGHNYGFTTKGEAEDACNQISECGGYKDDKNGSKKYHLRRNSDPTELTGPFKSGAHEVNRYKKEFAFA